MSVQINSQFLFTELGKLYAEVKALSAEVERLRAELAEKETLPSPTT